MHTYTHTAKTTKEHYEAELQQILYVDMYVSLVYITILLSKAK